MCSCLVILAVLSDLPIAKYNEVVAYVPALGRFWESPAFVGIIKRTLGDIRVEITRGDTVMYDNVLAFVCHIVCLRFIC